eukprot:EG_transcript_5913
MSHHILNSTRSLVAFDKGVLMHQPSIFYLGSRTRSFFYAGFEEEEDLDPRWVHRLPAKPTLWDRITFPIMSFRAWMRLLGDNFGWKFLAMVFCGQHLLKGMLAGGGSQGLLMVEGLIYMRLHVGASMKTVYQSIGNSAWGLKPLFALISDTVSIGGYRRTPWIILTAVLGTASYLCLVLDSAAAGGALVCLCFFCAKLQLAFTDLMVEATYTEKMRDRPRFAADIVSFAWSGIGLFGMIGIFIAGPGVDLLGPILILALAIPFSSLIIFPASAGWMTEKRLPPEKRGLQLDQIRREKNYVLCTLILTVGVLVTIITGVMNVSAETKAGVALGVSVITGVASVVLLPGRVWKPLLYMFVCNSVNLATAGFVDNFYLDPGTRKEAERTGYPMCEDCPHFSATFYYTVMGVADSVFTLIGSYIFSQYISHWSYRRALCVSQVLLTAAGFLDIVQYQRWNLLLGLPDWFFMLGKSSVQNTTGMINFMPTTILMSKVCPPGMEATVFALLAGFSNFGLTISGYLGAYVLQLTGMDRIGQGTEDDFSNAWQACLLGAILTPLSLLLLPLLIPDASMTEDLPRDEDEEEEEEAPGEGMRLLTNGSNLFDGEPRP